MLDMLRARCPKPIFCSLDILKYLPVKYCRVSFSAVCKARFIFYFHFKYNKPSLIFATLRSFMVFLKELDIC